MSAAHRCPGQLEKVVCGAALFWTSAALPAAKSVVFAACRAA
jgi:hypothetical protein